MSENKESRRYWLKLRQHYFETDHMVYLETVENGDKYAMIWVRLLLLCLKDTEENAGFLRFNSRIPYDDKLLAKVLRKDIDTIRAAMATFQNLGMIEILDDGTLYIEEVQSMIGSESSSAERVRKHREKKQLLQKSIQDSKEALQCNRSNALQSLQSNGEALHCNTTDVTISHNIIRERVDKEEEKEKEAVLQNNIVFKTNPELSQTVYQTFESQYGAFLPNQQKEIDAIEQAMFLAEKEGDPQIIVPAMIESFLELKNSDTSKSGFWRNQPPLPSRLITHWAAIRETIKNVAADDFDFDEVISRDA